MLPFLLACAPPAAPERFEDMMGFGFEHLGDQDPRPLEDLAVKLRDWLEANFDDLADGYAISPLTEANLVGAGVDASVEEGIVGVVAGVRMAVSLDRVAHGLAWDDQQDIFSSYLAFERATAHDPLCFEAGDCLVLDTVDTVTADVGLGITYDTEYDLGYRWIELDDGSPTVFRRMSGPDPVEFNKDFLAVHQQYGFSFFYENEDGQTRRIQAIWADGEVVGGDAEQDLYMSLAIRQILTASAELEAWVVENGG